MVFQAIPELNYLIEELEKTLKYSDKCDDIEKLYENSIKRYPNLKRYSLVLGTNDTSKQYFNMNITNLLHKNEFTDGNLKMTVNHQWLDFSNIIYLTKNYRHNPPIIDMTVSIDTNSMNFIDKFYRTSKINDFLKLKIKYNIDMNYLPYMFEDHINPYKNLYIKSDFKNLEELEKKRVIRERKIKNFEIVNHINKDLFNESNIIEFDKRYLFANHYNSFEEYYANKLFYFNNFFDIKDANIIKLPNNGIFYDSPNRIEINYMLQRFDLLYGYILQIVIEKFKAKNNSVEDKIHNILKNMFLNGQQLTQLLYFAFNYFTKDNELKINKFFNFNKSWGYQKIIEKAYNITWDIFLYTITQDFLSNPSRIINGKQFNADVGIPMFLTEDNKFFSSYIKHHSTNYYIIDEMTQGRPYYSVSNSALNDEEFYNYLITFEKKYSNLTSLKAKRLKKFKSFNHLYSMSRLFKEQMEKEIKTYLEK